MKVSTLYMDGSRFVLWRGLYVDFRAPGVQQFDKISCHLLILHYYYMLSWYFRPCSHMRSTFRHGKTYYSDLIIYP